MFAEKMIHEILARVSVSLMNILIIMQNMF